MIDGSLWARSVAIPLHWKASKDEQLLPRGGGGANKAKITLNYFSFREKSPKRQTHALKRRKIVRKKETVFTDIGDL